MGAREEIEHVVVLMLENRSFDGVLGQLYPKSEAFDGLSGRESNPYHKPDGTVEDVPVWNNDGMDPTTATIPDPDPGELFAEDMNVQLFGLGGTPSDAPPPMTGFVDNYVRQPSAAGMPDPRAVMHYFTPTQVPVISALAREFGVSDRWHASAPCQTWPNRFFTHTATAGGFVDNTPAHVYSMPSIFRRLGDRGKTWRVYFHDMPQSAALADLWDEMPLHFRFIDEFERDAAADALPSYGFIEPRYFASTELGLIPNDAHPPHNVVYAEQLVARVYNAVRAGPGWKRTLLIVTFDEHGGCFDHVPPPRAVPPGPPPADGSFAFDRYGVRVPAVIVSPFIAPGIVRPAKRDASDPRPPYPFDHTSIIATLRKLFDLGEPLTGRDAVAPDLLDALGLDEPLNDGPPRLDPSAIQPSGDEVAVRAAAPPNHMQTALCEMAAHLPASPAAAVGVPGSAPVRDAAAPAKFDELPLHEAAAYAIDRLRSFIGR